MSSRPAPPTARWAWTAPVSPAGCTGRPAVGDIGQITDNQIANPRFHPVAQGAAVPGDLVFFGASANNPAHVGIYTGAPGGVPTMINAPATGRFVSAEPVSAHSSLIGYYHYS